MPATRRAPSPEPATSRRKHSDESRRFPLATRAEAPTSRGAAADSGPARCPCHTPYPREAPPVATRSSRASIRWVARERVHAHRGRAQTSGWCSSRCVARERVRAGPWSRPGIRSVFIPVRGARACACGPWSRPGVRLVFITVHGTRAWVRVAGVRILPTRRRPRMVEGNPLRVLARPCIMMPTSNQCGTSCVAPWTSNKPMHLTARCAVRK